MIDVLKEISMDLARIPKDKDGTPFTYPQSEQNPICSANIDVSSRRIHQYPYYHPN